jgi:lipopolysaccharide biosynthesis protein
MTKSRISRAIALYLPQFHPIPENDEWWGKGFTEWTNTAKAKPLFPGHYQPHIPSDLGFYDLRVPDVREQQAELARASGIEGFCYYHYWFAGRQILERPFMEVLESGKPDFPFCVCWANETWSGIWHGTPDRVLIQQTYPGIADHTAHFQSLRPAFSDPRYIKVDGKPLFVVYKPQQILDCRSTLDLWRSLAIEAGLSGLHIVGFGSQDWNPLESGFDAKIVSPLVKERPWISRRTPIKWLLAEFNKKRGRPTLRLYSDIVSEHILSLKRDKAAAAGSYSTYPCVVHAWDNTPRSGVNGVVLSGSTPEKFYDYIKNVLDLLDRSTPDRSIVFLKSWNEWAEGNHIEPDMKYGHSYLDKIRASIKGEIV